MNIVDKSFCKGARIINRMNNWWDKNEEKQVITLIGAMVILIGISLLDKGPLLGVAFFLLLNRVLHRFGTWDKLQHQLDELTSFETEVKEINDKEGAPAAK